MAINEISYDNKSDINTSTTPVQNKVSASDMNEIKSVVNSNANLMGDLSNLNTSDKTSLVQAVNEINTPYDLITDGDAVLTGRKIDGKDEYVKRYSITLSSSGSGMTGEKALGFTLNDVTIIKFEGTIPSNTKNIFNLDTDNFNAGDNYVYANTTSNKLIVNCNTQNYSGTLYVNVYYIIN